MYISLSKAVAQAHRRLFPDEPRDARTLQTIALALTELMPIHAVHLDRELTEPELLGTRFTEPVMEQLAVSKVRFEAALQTLQITSLEMARVSLTMRQSPRPPSGRR